MVQFLQIINKIVLYLNKQNNYLATQMIKNNLFLKLKTSQFFPKTITPIIFQKQTNQIINYLTKITKDLQMNLRFLKQK